jgi:hypothetical protein
MLVTTNSKGCVDTVTKVVDVTQGPDLAVGFVDTLICSIDTLQLESSSLASGATFNWFPAYDIIDSTSNQPLVYPKQTTTYDVTVSKNGCSAKDSVLVNVIDKVTLSLCKTDSIQIIPSTNALYFSWSPPESLSNASTEQPFARPLSNTRYSLTASVGKCFAMGAMDVNVVPYPVADAGVGATVCFGSTAQLNANIVGSTFSWSPTSSLYKANTLRPIAGPQSTTKYTLYVTDTLGCPKPGIDSVLVTVIPKVAAFAGDDTTVVRNQPLQLNASGGEFYHWTPTSGLSNPDIANPVAVFTDSPDTVSYNVRVSTPEGCVGNDSIRIFIFKTQPGVFIPTAFTPNGDGIKCVQANRSRYETIYVLACL